MNRKRLKAIAYLQIALILVSTGCHTPTQPFYLHEDGDLSHYLHHATDIEYPDGEFADLEDAAQAHAPLTVDHHNYEFWELSLEECVSIALNNSKIFRVQGQAGVPTANGQSQILSADSAALASVYSPAIQSSTTQSIPLIVDGSGNRTLPRGAFRSNQVGGVEDALAEFDAQVSAFLSYNTTDRARNVGPNNPFNPVHFRSWDSTQQLAISKRNATGTITTLRQQTIYSRNNIVPNSIGRSVASDYTFLLQAEIQHPLMRNRGAMINRTPVMLAALNEDITLTDFEIQVRSLVQDVENAYWDLYRAYRFVDAAQTARDSAQATARFAQVQFDGGKGAVQDLAQAEEQFFAFNAELTAALTGSRIPGRDPNGLYGHERNLRYLMGIAATDGRLIRPGDEPSLARVNFDWHEILCEAIHRSPELRAQKFRIKQRELECNLAKNQMLPDLNISTTLTWLGVGDTLGPSSRRGTNFPNAGSSALAEFTEGEYTEVAARLDFTPAPLGSRREKARVRNAQLQLRRDQEALYEKQLALSHQLSDSVAELYTAYNLIENGFHRWTATEREVQARLEAYQAGESPVNVVLQSQQRRAQAQRAYYEALTEYNKTVSDIHSKKGSLLDYNNICLEEGPWARKAYWDALERARERDASYYLNYGYTRPGVVRRGPVEKNLGRFGQQAAAGGQALPGEVIYGGEMMQETVPGMSEEIYPLQPPEELDPPPVPMPETAGTSPSVLMPAIGGTVAPASFTAPSSENVVPLNPFRS